MVASGCVHRQAFIANCENYPECMFSAECQAIGFSLKTGYVGFIGIK